MRPNFHTITQTTKQLKQCKNLQKRHDFALLHNGQTVKVIRNAGFREFNELQDEAWDLRDNDPEAQKLYNEMQELEKAYKAKKAQFYGLYKVIKL